MATDNQKSAPKLTQERKDTREYRLRLSDHIVAILSLLTSIAAAYTTYLAYKASVSSNEISERSNEINISQAQPIITSHIDNDTLFVDIKKDHRGINFVDARPLISFVEGVVSEKSLESMKMATFKYKTDVRRPNCMMDEPDMIKCYEPELTEYLKILNGKLKQLPDDPGKMSFRNASIAYIFSISYNDIFDKRQRRILQVNHRSHPRRLSDSTFKERISHMETLSMADTTLDGILKIQNQLSQNRDKMMPRQNRD